MSPDKQTGQSPAAAPRVKRRGQPRSQVADTAVSRAKFAREVEALCRHEAEYRNQGWFLLSAEFPEVFLVLTATQLRPAPVLFGVVVNFVNYDVEPPSVLLVNPWTREPFRARELLSPLPRVIQRPAAPAPTRGEAEPTPFAPGSDDRDEGGDAAQAPDALGPLAQPAPQQEARVEVGNLMQWWTPDSIPFLCMRGVREYHRHPAHTGDAWLLHRGRGEGTLSAILSAIHDHGRTPIQDFVYEFNLLNQQAQHNAFLQQLTVRVRGFLNALPGGILYPWLF
jgi:hypothetical protein